MGGLPYGGQPLSLGPDAGKSGKYGEAQKHAIRNMKENCIGMEVF